MDKQGDAFVGQVTLTGKRIVVSGATGFIGRRVVAACLAAGADVTAIVRSRGAEKALGSGVRVVTVGSPQAMGQVLKGADCLCHLAYDMRADQSENLELFDGVMDAAKAAHVGRIVHASSVVVYDDWPNGDLTEASLARSKGGGDYRQSKIAIEARLLAGDVPAAILQPTLVYGPQSAFWTDQLAKSLKRGLVLPEPSGVLSAVYVDDVAQAFVRAAALEDLGQETFLISGPDGTWEMFLGGYAARIGGTLLREPVDALAEALGPAPDPGEGVSLAARVSAMGRRILGHGTFEALVGAARGLRPKPSGPVRPDHFLFGLMTAKGRVRIDHARERLGYEPEFDIDRGLIATESYLRSQFGT